ncbi:hypothetical protein BD777DRAFT_138177 [Yarrowia lipolytica]|jgi:hypothetical protein|uniref:Uncharacterized protein n=1 Tax=Yarrowia lipolytica TaxID=4952 RepID=A0A1D8N4A6_YARLL|nr:hypothetical protein YALI1_A09787g [Yarrowia lipolytica]QNP95542.1 Hypothetical protein YALI2_A00541g [Yarrowia lipolytica]RMI94615.1 hypothetical protein BD777DRAFT_138177 [Yarrowia lipolytica]
MLCRCRTAGTITPGCYVYVKLKKMVAGHIPRAAGSYMGPQPVVYLAHDSGIVIETPPYFTTATEWPTSATSASPTHYPNGLTNLPFRRCDIRNWLNADRTAFIHLKWKRPSQNSYLVSWKIATLPTPHALTPSTSTRPPHRSDPDCDAVPRRPHLWPVLLRFRGFHEPPAL